MSDTQTVKRAYRVTFIFDTRGYEDPLDTLVAQMKQVLGELGADIETDHGMERHDFAHVTDRKHMGDQYLKLDIAAPAKLNEELQERLRLDRRVKRIMVESR